MLTNNYTQVYKYIQDVQIHQNRADPVVGDLKWSIRSDNHKGWLLCNGADIEIDKFPRLYGIIGDSFGVSTPNHFKLPDVRGRVLGGIGDGLGSLTTRNLGDAIGEETHTLTVAEMPSHQHSGTTSTNGSHAHTINDPGHSHTYVNNTNNQDTDNAFSTETAADNADLSATTGSSTTGIVINANGDHTHTFVSNSTGGSQPHNNMQPTLFVSNVFIFCGDFFEE